MPDNLCKKVPVSPGGYQGKYILERTLERTLERILERTLECVLERTLERRLERTVSAHLKKMERTLAIVRSLVYP